MGNVHFMLNSELPNAIVSKYSRDMSTYCMERSSK